MKDPKQHRPRAGKRSVVLLSGGIDSAVVLAMETAHGADVYALTAMYRQRNSVEVTAAKRLAEHYDVADHRIIELDLSLLGRSPLTGSGEIPCRTLEEIRNTPSPAYVPARNTILLSIGLALCETMDCDKLLMGMNRDDWPGFPDCRPEFIVAWQGLGRVATLEKVTIEAPLLRWPKSQVIQAAVGLYEIPLGMTFSCYQPVNGIHCGRCDACILRRDAAAKVPEKILGWTDPTEYAVDL